jgi:hypothetical protein
MGYNKPKETTRTYLENAPLPNHGNSYTVISHKHVIDNTEQLLSNSGFRIDQELYRANMNANVAQGIYHIYPSQTTDQQILDESELGMMFAWTNSYDKSTKFQCAIGGYVMVCSNGMMAGDMMNFKRKHTGSADQDIRNQISNQIKNGEKYYKRILNDRDSLRNTNLSLKEQAEILGRLYINEELLDTTQMSCIRSEYDSPTHDYNSGRDTAWTFYNHVTFALKKAHPRHWLQNSQDFHDFIMTEVVSLSVNVNALYDLNKYKVVQDTDFQLDKVEYSNLNINAIEIDEDITPSKLIHDVYIGN